MALINKVGVVGGGTAGYLTALCVKKFIPEAKVSVIESPSIPIIGVGESTTPKLLRMLHTVLGFELGEFYREVQPTWKLGVRYLWGDEAYPFANNALGDIGPFSSLSAVGDLNYNSLNSILMNQHKGFVVDSTGDGSELKSVARPCSYAYHLDNVKLSAYLKKKARDRGIELVEATIVDTQQSAEGDLATLVCEDGRHLSFDFFVDCSGFRSLLSGGTMKVPYKSYQDSLFTDMALAGSAPHGGDIKPFTEARTMDSGWQWNIPMREEDHLGYIFSSAFCNSEQAEREFRSLNPGLGDVRLIRFKSGRRTEMIRRNVVAVGNSYGFIEALQSTALHMVITNIYAAVLHLKNLERGSDLSKGINQSVGEIWDQLRWFIAMQFRLNRRRSSAFWRACNTDANIDGAEKLIARYRQQGLLARVKDDDPMLSEINRHHIFGLFSHDFMLLVLGIGPGGDALTMSDLEREQWRGRYRIWDQLADRALPQSQILPMVDDDPLLLSFEDYFKKPFLLDREFDLFDEVNIAQFIVQV